DQATEPEERPHDGSRGRAYLPRRDEGASITEPPSLTAARRGRRIFVNLPYPPRLLVRWRSHLLSSNRRRVQLRRASRTFHDMGRTAAARASFRTDPRRNGMTPAENATCQPTRMASQDTPQANNRIVPTVIAATDETRPRSQPRSASPPTAAATTRKP